MKKIPVILCLALLLSLAACSEKPTTSNPDETTPASQMESEQDKDNNEQSTDNDGEEENSNESEKEVTFEEVVAVDNEECFVKITGIEPDSMWGYTLKAQLENKSAEKNYRFSVESAAINGVQSDPFFTSEVASGKKANEEIRFTDSELEDNGISEYTDIELTFRIYDADDWSADDVALETVHIYPYGEDKAVQFVRESQPTDNVLIDNDDVTVIVTGYEKDIIWGYRANLFLINKTDKELMFSSDDDSVNGFMIDSYFAKKVIPGKSTFTSMNWSDGNLEENGIEEVEEIEFVLAAKDANDFMSDDIVNETITLKP